MPAFKPKKLSLSKKINLTSVWRARLVLALLGLVLILPNFLLGGKTSETKVPGVTSFSNEPVKIEQGLLKGKPKGEFPLRVIIPSLKIDVPVKPAKIVKGYWELFEDAAGFGQGSAYPGEAGNTVIFAHTRPGLFQALKDAKIGMTIYVFTKEKWFSYKVEKITEVFPNQVEVIAPTPDETLTLYTCSGFADQKRLIVTAKRI